MVDEEEGVVGVIGIYGCLFGSDAERRREDGHVGRIAQGPACKSSSLPHNNCPRQPSIALSPAPLSPPHSLLTCQTTWAAAVASTSEVLLLLSLTRAVVTAGEDGRKQTVVKPGP